MLKETETLPTELQRLPYDEKFREILEGIYPILKRNPPYLHFVKVTEVKTPERGTGESAGIDFFIPDNMSGHLNFKPKFQKLWVKPGESILIPSGIHVKIPKGWALVATNKSGIATKKGLSVGACLIDSDYQGQVHIHLFNTTNEPIALREGEKVVQFVLTEVALVQPQEFHTIDRLYAEAESERGTGGFGSTGDGLNPINE